MELPRIVLCTWAAPSARGDAEVDKLHLSRVLVSALDEKRDRGSKIILNQWSDGRG